MSAASASRSSTRSTLAVQACAERNCAAAKPIASSSAACRSMISAASPSAVRSCLCTSKKRPAVSVSGQISVRRMERPSGVRNGGPLIAWSPASTSSRRDPSSLPSPSAGAEQAS
jgi:hypothetical protein